MRLLGTLKLESLAHRFAAYLLTQGIESHMEEDGSAWAVWIRDEDHLDRARSEFERFRVDPDSERYEGALQDAEAILREKHRKEEESRKNVVVMRGQWKSGAATKKNLTWTIIVLSVAVTLFANFSKVSEDYGRNVAHDYLAFRSDASYTEAKDQPFREIMHGQVWRTVTPIFLHGSWQHLIFNLIWIFYFGVQIETKLGPWKLVLIVLAVAVFTNVTEALMPQEFFERSQIAMPTADGIGISGVVFGLFGFVWLRMMLTPHEGFNVHPLIIALHFGYLVLGITGALEKMSPTMSNIDHWAHGLGLVGGVGMAYLLEIVGSKASPKK